MSFLILVEYEVEGDNEKNAINTLVKLANLEHATEADQITSCNIVDVMDRDRK